MIGTVSPLPRDSRSFCGAPPLLNRSSPNVETTVTLPSLNFTPRKRQICFNSGSILARNPEKRSCKVASKKMLQQEQQQHLLLETPPRRLVPIKKKGHPLKPPKPHFRSRPIVIPLSLVDTAPKLPSTAKMDLPLLVVGRPPTTTVDSMLTPPSNAMVSRTTQVPLPRRCPLQDASGAASPLPSQRQQQQQQQQKVNPSSEEDVVTKPPPVRISKLPLKLQLPDLPDIENPGRPVMMWGETTRAPRPELAMKPLC